MYEFRLKFVPEVWINDIPALVQILAGRRLGDKPLSEPVMASLLTHICVSRPQWVKSTSQHYYIWAWFECWVSIKSVHKLLTRRDFSAYTSIGLMQCQLNHNQNNTVIFSASKDVMCICHDSLWFGSGHLYLCASRLLHWCWDNHMIAFLSILWKRRKITMECYA